jgi:hypothetical protein
MVDRAIQKGYTKRYLPEKAWASLSKEERAETDQKKRAASREGKQFVPTQRKQRKLVELHAVIAIANKS